MHARACDQDIQPDRALRSLRLPTVDGIRMLHSDVGVIVMRRTRYLLKATTICCSQGRCWDAGWSAIWAGKSLACARYVVQSRWHTLVRRVLVGDEADLLTVPLRADRSGGELPAVVVSGSGAEVTR